VGYSFGKAASTWTGSHPDAATAWMTFAGAGPRPRKPRASTGCFMTCGARASGVGAARASLKKAAMLISGHKTRSVFERYNIVDERDLHAAAEKLYQHLNGKIGNGQK
jgi:hypothetical protein